MCSVIREELICIWDREFFLNKLNSQNDPEGWRIRGTWDSFSDKNWIPRLSSCTWNVNMVKSQLGTYFTGGLKISSVGDPAFSTICMIQLQ